MSVIRKKPYIETLVNGLTGEQKAKLLVEMDNTAFSTFKSFIDPNFAFEALDTGEWEIDGVLLQLDAQKQRNGIVIRTMGDTLDEHLLVYGESQKITIYKIDSINKTFNLIEEYCDINELRRVVENALGGVGEEIEIKIYASDLALTEQVPYINNAEKIAQIDNLIDALQDGKVIFGSVEAPYVNYGEADIPLQLYIKSVCSDGGNRNEDAEAINMYDGIANYGAGFSRVHLDATNTMYVTNIAIGAATNDYALAIVQKLASDEASYIEYKFKVMNGGSVVVNESNGGSGIVEVELPEITLSDLVFNSEDNTWMCVNANFLNGIELLKQRKVVSLQHHISYEYGEQDNSSSFTATVCNEAFENGNLFNMPLFGLSLNGILSDGTNTMVAFLGDGEELARGVIFSLQDMSSEYITNLINFSFTLKYYYFE